MMAVRVGKRSLVNLLDRKIDQKVMVLVGVVAVIYIAGFTKFDKLSMGSIYLDNHATCTL